LFPPDNNSDPEEEERNLPPPSSLTQVAARIRNHVSKYLDDQAKDSDKEAEEEHEGDEQEMKDDFVHRFPSNKDDAGEVQKWVAHFQNTDKVALYEQDVAREAAVEAGTPGRCSACESLPSTTGPSICALVCRSQNLDASNTWKCWKTSTSKCTLGFVPQKHLTVTSGLS
jgi:hypothetical protein